MRNRLYRFMGWMALVIVVSAVVLGTSLNAVMDEEGSDEGMVSAMGQHDNVVIAVAIAIVTVGASWSAAYAVAKVGSAAMGAVSENPELMGRSLVFVGLAEGIAIYGLIIAIMLLQKMG